jgi:hypothetical protein
MIRDHGLQHTSCNGAETAVTVARQWEQALKEWVWRICPREGSAFVHKRLQLELNGGTAHVGARQDCMCNRAAVAK